MKRFKKWMALFVMAAGIVSAVPVTAFAFTEETVQEEAVPETEAPVAVEETVEETEKEATPFSVPGNGQLLDDKSDDGTKQFLTVQTKNGNTFFLVLDRSNHTENVYMLSMIDENDLAEFVENKPVKPEPEAPQVVIPEKEEHIEEQEPEKELKKQPEGSNIGALLAVALLVGGIGGFYYLKVVKPKKEEEEADGEDLEFYDGGEYVNEDEPENSEEE